MGAGGAKERRSIDRPFLGRDRELDELKAALSSAQSGRGRLCLITGDPGIGKTRLADELTASAQGSRVVALWGRCWEGGGAPAYWPWIQIVRAYLRREDGSEALRTLGEHASPIGHLIGDGGPQYAEGIDMERARFALFDAVARLLAGGTSTPTLLLILDDLHAADVPSLLLMQFLARDLRDRRMLIVGTYREVEARLAGAGDLIAELAREGSHIFLRGLAHPVVAQLIEQTSGNAPSKTTVDAVFRATEGNPFFVDEVVRLLAAESALEEDGPAMIRIPDGVRDAIRGRFRFSSPRSEAILSAASIVGKEFDSDVVERVADTNADDLADALQDGTKLRLIQEMPLPPGRYAFSHALIRETIYDSISSSERVRLHNATAKALEDLHPTRISEIAHHYFAGIRGGGSDRALEFSERAAEQAAAALAYEDARLHYEHALHAHALTPSGGEETRCRLLLGLGDAHWRSGDTAAAQETFRSAATVARKIGGAEELARAALGYAVGLGGFFFVSRADQPTIALLEEALAGLGPDDSVLRCRVLARLAIELYYTGRIDERSAVSGAAVAMARRLGHPVAQALSLFSRNFAVWGPDSMDERLSNTEEMLRLSRDAADPEMAALAHHFRFTCFFELGDRVGTDQEVAECIRHCEELRQPFYRWRAVCLRAMQAILAGRFAEAERLAEEAYRIGRLRDYEIATVIYDQVHLYAIRWAQGRLPEMEDRVRRYSEEFPWVPRWRVGFLDAQAGTADQARSELERHGQAEAFRTIPRDGHFLLLLSSLAHACRLVGDQDAAASLYDLLRPYARRNTASLADLAYGAVALRLGMLGSMLGRWDESVRHFDDALEFHAALGAQPLEVITLLERGRALVTASERSLRMDGAQSLELAETGARALEMTGVFAEAKNIPRPKPPARPVSSSAVSLSAEGDYWTLSDAEGIVRLKDTKGLRVLARLLAHPRREFHALDLASAAESGATPGQPRSLVDVEEERAGRANAAELRPGGEDVSASDVGRARVNVTRTIRDAIQRIAATRPALGHHLDSAVRTGTFSSYSPGRESGVEWHL